jgi:hypothetical protein
MARSGRSCFVASPAMRPGLLLRPAEKSKEKVEPGIPRPARRPVIRESNGLSGRLGGCFSRKARGMPTFSGCEMLGRATTHREE